jgi:shikimate dehydrogenase
LLLGAGGAARGVMGPLLEQEPTQLIVANRSSAKADELVGLFHDFANNHHVQLESHTLLDLEDQIKTPLAFDLVINATAAGLSDQSPLTAQAVSHVFVPSSFAYDMVYGKTTAFMQQALHRGARVSDGLGMLVEQAADAFLIWRGADASIDPRSVLSELRT